MSQSPCYQFWTNDQAYFIFVTQVLSEDGDSYEVQPRFREALCPNPQCGVLDADAVFAKGWEQTVERLRPRVGCNLLVTDDDFLCVADSLLRILVDSGVGGFECKPLPESDWQVLRITNRRKFDPKVYQTSGSVCGVCKRVGQYGTVRYEREIDLPTETLTFFSTDKPRGQGGYDIFVTDKLRALLVESGAKGGELHRLLTEEEEALEKANPKWKPKGFLVSL